MQADRYLKRMDELIEQAKDMLGRLSDVTLEFAGWTTSVNSIIGLTFGERDIHYLNYCDQEEKTEEMLDRGHYDGVRRCLEILKAARHDWAAGLLTDIRELVAAEVFDDLLDMARYLLDEGFHLPAAALAGGVLEDSLRKLCTKHGVEWEGHSAINILNMALYKAKAYNKPDMGLVDAWGKLRNQVDHGEFKAPSDVDATQVGLMVDGVRHFIGKHLA